MALYKAHREPSTGAPNPAETSTSQEAMIGEGEEEGVGAELSVEGGALL